jgi:hypothetical protein
MAELAVLRSAEAMATNMVALLRVKRLNLDARAHT